MTKIKKVAAGILAAVSLAACVGGMSASAYSPTITKTVNGVKGTLYSDASYATGTTAYKGETCYVKVLHGGVASNWYYSLNSVALQNKNSNGSTSATSWHRIAGGSIFSIVY